MAGVNLKKLLSNEKFLPFYEERADNNDSLPPVAVELHWTSTCNYSCIHCSYGKRREERLKLEKETIEKLVNDLTEMGVQSVYLSGGGEPTTIKNWQKWAQKLVDNEVEVALITNGVSLAQEDAPVLGKLNYIANSVYSVKKENYEKITGSKFFDKQFKLPELVKPAKTNTIVGARCVLNDTNYAEVFDIYQKAMEANFDYIIFIPAVDYEGTGLALKQEEIETIVNTIKENYDSFDLTKTNVDSILAKNIHHYEETPYLEKFESEPEGCSAINIRGNAFVNYDGEVYLCQPHIGNKKYSIGNVNQTSFREIWNSDRHFEVAEALGKEFISGNCRNCRGIGFNKIADEYEQLPDKFDLLQIPYDPFI